MLDKRNTVPHTVSIRSIVTALTGDSQMLVKFSTLANGVFIEETGADKRTGTERCFRFDAEGRAEYAFYSDLISANPAPRWFGHCFKEADFLFA